MEPKYKPLPEGALESFLSENSFRTSTQRELNMMFYCTLVLVENGTVVSWRQNTNQYQQPSLVIGSEIYVHPMNFHYWTTRDQCMAAGVQFD